MRTAWEAVSLSLRQAFVSLKRSFSLTNGSCLYNIKEWGLKSCKFLVGYLSFLSSFWVSRTLLSSLLLPEKTSSEGNYENHNKRWGALSGPLFFLTDLLLVYYGFKFLLWGECLHMNMRVSASVCVLCALFLWLLFFYLFVLSLSWSVKRQHTVETHTAEHFTGVGLQF